MASRCGRAIFFPDKDLIELRINPIIWSDENQVTGELINIYLKDKRLRSLYAKKNAMAISKADTALPDRYNQLTGQELTMYFSANKLQQVDVQKTAISLYYLFDNNEPNGVNKSSGDRILIDFQNGEVDRIKVMNGVQGQYFPEKMILHRESDYNLDGFKLYKNRPVRNGVFITSQ